MTVHPAPVAESEVQPSLGDRLRQLREEQNLSLDDVSRATRVSLANLRAIEAQAYDRLPADPFAKGMVVLYATHLGLDGFQAGARFLAERHRGGGIRSASQQNLARFSLLPKKLAEKLFAYNNEIDRELTRSLCPKCRQLEDAKRNACVLPAASGEAAATSVTSAAPTKD